MNHESKITIKLLSKDISIHIVIHQVPIHCVFSARDRVKPRVRGGLCMQGHKP